jgi:2-oxoglutarate ferredoxin oxidoreductase subunit alpha
MAIPGTPGVTYTAEGLEHGERGTPSSQAADHLSQLDKRLRKLQSADYAERWADVAGDGDLAVIAFGSCTGPLREALAALASAGLRMRLISLRLLAPFPAQQLADALAGVRKAVVIEQNHSAQLYKYLRGECDLPCAVTSRHKPGGVQFQPGELQRYLAEWSAS